MICFYKKKNMRKHIVLSLLLLAAGFASIVLIGLSIPGCSGAKGVKESKVKNVIMMVYDGQSTGAITCARWYKGQALAMDEMAAGLCSTYMGDSIITDSAPAATAFATGHKSNNGHISVLPVTPVITPGARVPAEEQKGMPVATLLEGARQIGKATGIIATAFIQHATPACFSAHISNRSNYEVIAEQQVHMGINVVLGGGDKFLRTTVDGGFREDGEDLIKVVKENHYEYITTRDQLLNSKAVKIWGMFAGVDMAYDLDRRHLHPEQPSLPEMVQKAIEVLSKNPQGFFLFVESSKTDWAAHANDPVGVIGEMLALDDAVAVALNFARTHPDTLIVLFPDHDTGGMTIGSKESNDIYEEITKEMVFTLLKRAKLTGKGVEEILAKSADRSTKRIREVVFKYYGIGDLTDEEVRVIANCTGNCSLSGILGPMISKRTYIGWSTAGHTGNDVPFHSYGPERPTGHFDNTDIAKICAQRMGFNLEDISAELFIDAQEAFTGFGAAVRIDKTDVKNPVLAAQKGAVTVRIPFHKNILYIDSIRYQMPGIAVFNPNNNKLYIPKASVELVKERFIGGMDESL